MKQWIGILIVALIASPAFSQSATELQASVKEIKHLKLYPKVVDKYVNIYAEFDSPTDFTLRLPPSTLNNEKAWSIKAKENYQTSMDVTQLPNGTYTIILSYEGKKEEQTFKVDRAR